MNLKLINNSSLVMTTLPSSIANVCTGLYINNCNGVNQIALLRDCSNLTNIYCDNVGNISGPISELVRYGSCHGFDASGNPDNTAAPTINGTFTINAWYTDDQLASIQNIVINGLTVIADQNYNVSALINNGEIAVQTIDSTKANYNPAVGIIYASNNIGHIISDGWFLTKTEALTFTKVGTYFKEKTTVIDTQGIVSSDITATYDFKSFNELQYFTNIVATSGEYPFSACIKLNNIIIPYNMTGGQNYGLTEAYNAANSRGYIGESYDVGKITFKGDVQIAGRRIFARFKTFVFYGNFSGATSYYPFESTDTHEIYIKGNVSNNLFKGSNSNVVSILSIGGSCSGETKNAFYQLSRIDIVHLGYSGICCSPTYITIAKCTKVYVGDGSSKTSDEDVFDLYNADTNWAAYCGSGVPGAGKVDLWWNYNGTYRTYNVEESLSGCTNSNSITWPYITRCESYSTKLVPNSGLSLETVTVEMYEAVDNGATPNTPTDITSSVYDSSTGEINISSVTGNIIITANAS